MDYKKYILRISLQENFLRFLLTKKVFSDSISLDIIKSLMGKAKRISVPERPQLFWNAAVGGFGVPSPENPQTPLA